MVRSTTSNNALAQVLLKGDRQGHWDFNRHHLRHSEVGGKAGPGCNRRSLRTKPFRRLQDDRQHDQDASLRHA